MQIPEFKKIARLLKEAYKELEIEALNSGVDIFSDQYKELQDVTRETILTKMGFTIEEYRLVKDEFTLANQKKTKQAIEEVTAQIDELKAKPLPEIPTKEEIASIAHEVAKQYIVPPVITNQIIKETTIEKPVTIENTVIKKEEYDPSPLMAEIGFLNDKVDKIEIPKPFNPTDLEERLSSKFQEQLENNTNMLDMPNLRKMGIGLRQDLDTKVEGVGTTKITVSGTAPTNAKYGDLWVNTG